MCVSVQFVSAIADKKKADGQRRDTRSFGGELQSTEQQSKQTDYRTLQFRMNRRRSRLDGMRRRDTGSGRGGCTRQWNWSNEFFFCRIRNRIQRRMEIGRHTNRVEHRGSRFNYTLCV